MTKACIVPNCKTGYKSYRVKRSVFKAPNDEEMRKKWAALIPGICHLKPTQFVCERHFRADCITRKYVKHDNNGKLIAEVPLKRPYLTVHAVPTIFIAEDDEPSLAIEGGEMVVTEQNILGEQNDSKIIEDGTHAIAEDTKQFCDNILSIDTADIKAPCVNDFKVGSERRNGMHLESETSIERCLLVDPPISKLQVVSTGCVGDGKNIISLPETWSVTKSIAKTGTEITFCHITTLTQNDIKSLIVNKFFVIENWTGRIQFYVHGREFCTDNTPLPSIIQNASPLREILATFDRMHICRGSGYADSSLIKNDAFQDQSNSWHHNQCTLLTKSRICDGCKTLKSTVRKRKSRAINPRESKTYFQFSVSNQIEHVEKESEGSEGEIRSCLKANSGIENGFVTVKVEVAAVKLEALAERLSTLENLDTEKPVMKKIIATANTSPKDRKILKDSDYRIHLIIYGPIRSRLRAIATRYEYFIRRRLATK